MPQSHAEVETAETVLSKALAMVVSDLPPGIIIVRLMHTHFTLSIGAHLAAAEQKTEVTVNWKRACQTHSMPRQDEVHLK